MGRGIEAAGRGARENLGFGRARGAGLPPHEFARGAELAVKPLQLPGLLRLWHPAAFCLVCVAQRFQETDTEQVRQTSQSLFIWGFLS